jgi:glycine amidinotransferase/scyllo-inosamine-4-phosphate amidinotransferase 1
MENLSKFNAHTEWGNLKEVILGIADNARVPVVKNHDIHSVDYANYETVDDLPGGYYSDRIIEDTIEDLNLFAESLKKLGIKVLRPEKTPTHKLHGTYNWRTDSYYNYCPRDSAIVIGDTCIETPMPLRARYFETFALRKIFKQYNDNGGRWISAPKPELPDELYDRTDLSKPTLTEFEPAFDAANIMKCGKDLIYLKSNSGNYAGAKWLQNVLGEKYRVHVVDNVYAYVHIDTSIVPLRPGVVLLNPDRVNENNCPAYFKNWKKIYSPEPFPTGFSEHWAPASPWLGMNVLSINENLVAVEASQSELMRVLNENKFDVLPVQMRHCRTLSGGPHCVTLDTVREDEYNDYS